MRLLALRNPIRLLALAAGAFVMNHAAHADGDDARKPVDAAQVARAPAPGTTVPGAFAYTPDAKALTYLKAEKPGDLARVLWRIDLPDGEARVVARPPGGGAGDTDASLSREEQLRRERQRQRDTGVTAAIRAGNADVAVLPLGGDLYLQRGDGPLERLTETPSPELDPRLTSDGSRVGFVRDGALYALDIATKTETKLSPDPSEGVTYGLAEFIAQEELDRSAGFWWSPDGRRVAYQETDERHVPLFTITHQGTAEPSVETHRYPFAGAANARVRLGVVAAEGGPTKWLTLAWPIDSDWYLARVDWDGPDHLLTQVLARDQKTLWLSRHDVRAGDQVQVLKETSNTWIDLHNDLRIVPGSGEFVWSSERSGLRQLELYDRAGRLVRTLTSDPWPIDAVLHLDAKRREVWYAAPGPDPRQAHLYRVSLDGGPSTRITPDGGTHRATVAPDASTFVLTSSDLNTPPRTTLRDRDGKPLRTLDDAAADPRLAELELVPPEPVAFEIEPGVTLYGAFYAPLSDALRIDGKAPVVVMVYGGPTVQTVTDSWPMTADLTAQFLAARGFAVWKCDNRGSSRRGRAFQEPIYRRMGSIEVTDQAAAVRHLASTRQDVDIARVGVTGGSYGGYMTLRSLLLAPDTFRAGVAVASVADWDGYDTAYTERYMSTPRDNPDGYREASALTRADRLTGRLLMVHGLIDENVHFRHSARMVEALIAAGRPFEVLPLPDSRHSTRKPEDRRYLAEKLARFFEDALAKRDH
jgi:dipeptidyl-peptidase-4